MSETDAPPPTPPSYVFELAGTAGYATPPIRGGVNPFGTGLGVRGGFIVSGVYFGASVMSYFGGSDSGASDQALLFGIELGYSLRPSQYLTLRPKVGFGDTILTHTEPPVPGVDVVTTASSSAGGLGATTQVDNVYVAPGLVAELTYGHWFVAFDVDLLILPGIAYGPAPADPTTWLSCSVGGQLGFRL